MKRIAFLLTLSPLISQVRAGDMHPVTEVKPNPQIFAQVDDSTLIAAEPQYIALLDVIRLEDLKRFHPLDLYLGPRLAKWIYIGHHPMPGNVVLDLTEFPDIGMNLIQPPAYDKNDNRVRISFRFLTVSSQEVEMLVDVGGDGVGDISYQYDLRKRGNVWSIHDHWIHDCI